jgi:hypothetical protein
MRARAASSRERRLGAHALELLCEQRIGAPELGMAQQQPLHPLGKFFDLRHAGWRSCDGVAGL